MTEPVTVEKFAIGQSVRRLEDPHLVQGLGRYSDDVRLPRQAHAMVVRSTHAHARIRGIDASAALESPGVLAVLTGDDLAADGLGNLPTDASRKRRDGTAAFTTPRPALIRGRVRHVGARRHHRLARAPGRQRWLPRAARADHAGRSQ